MNGTKLLVERRMTRIFIMDDEVQVQITRKPPQSTPAGGLTPGPEEILAPQSMRLVRNTTNPFATLKAGFPDVATTRDEWLLVGNHDADVAIGDTFYCYSRHFEVTTLLAKTDTEFIAGCKQQGFA